MRITDKNKKIDKAGKHNDRNFDISYAPHIDPERVKNNLYWTYIGDTSKKFNEIEKDFYVDMFSDHIKNQNKRNEAIRHKERNKTINDYLHDKRTRPEDKLLQIGNSKKHATAEQLWECAQEYRERFDNLYGESCKIIDMALHLDEEVPHVHIRRAWIAKDDYGDMQFSQNKALENLGFVAPDQDKANSKKNNASIAFTNADRQLFRNICIEKGLDIDLAPPKKEAVPELKDWQKKNNRTFVENMYSTCERLLEWSPIAQQVYADKLRKAMTKIEENTIPNLDEINELTALIMNKEMEIMESKNREKKRAEVMSELKYNQFSEYLKENGHGELVDSFEKLQIQKEADKKKNTDDKKDDIGYFF